MTYLEKTPINVSIFKFVYLTILEEVANKDSYSSLVHFFVLSLTCLKSIHREIFVVEYLLPNCWKVAHLWGYFTPLTKRITTLATTLSSNSSIWVAHLYLITSEFKCAALYCSRPAAKYIKNYIATMVCFFHVWITLNIKH